MRAIPIDRFITEDASPGGGVSEWQRLVAEGRAARHAADAGAWKIGRLALQVERHYRSGALRRFAEEIGESHGTVRRFRWVAAAYDPAARARFPELSFSHFQAVASLPDRTVWLERAARRGWSVDRLVRQSRTGREGSPEISRFTGSVLVATRAVSRLLERTTERDLARAARAGLLEAVEELAEQVERLRRKLRTAGVGPRVLPHSRSRARAR